MKRFIIIFFLISFPPLISFQSVFDSESIVNPIDSTRTINISFVGDLMCHSVQYNYAKAGMDTFNFTGVFAVVDSIFLKDDFTVGNLETVTAGRSVGYSGFPYFNTPDDFVYALGRAGFNLLVTANNHALDQGEKGLRRTIEIINKNGMINAGTFNSQQDRDTLRLIDLKGIRIAILAYTESTNGMPIPKGKEYILNLIDFDLIADDIKWAKDSGAEIIITHFHFGSEYIREPDNYQKSVVDSVINLGADIIIGGHPHVVQPVDYFKTVGGRLDTGFVAYSMGNFVSNQRWRYSDAGIILSIELTKNIFSDSIFISDVGYLPTWVFKGKTEKGKEYIILPSEVSAEDSTHQYLSIDDKKLMKEAFEDTKEIITKYTNKVRLQSIR